MLKIKSTVDDDAEKIQLINRTVDDKLTGTHTEIDDLKKRVKALEDYVKDKKKQDNLESEGAEAYSGMM